MGAAVTVPDPKKHLVKQTADKAITKSVSAKDENIQITMGFWKSYTKLRANTWKDEAGYQNGKYADTLKVKGKGISLTVKMAPLDSFKRMTTITDKEGNLVAAMYTGSMYRPSFAGEGVYNILSVAPRVKNQLPIMQTEQGVLLYHLATHKAPCTGNMHHVEMVDKSARYAVKGIFGDVRKMSIVKERTGHGIATSRKSREGDHLVDIAAGVDPLLVVCMIYTWFLANNEKESAGHGGGGGGCGGGG